MYLQLAVLKSILRKKSILNEHLNIIKLQHSNTQPAISSKNGANDGTICRSPENFNVFTGRSL